MQGRAISLLSDLIACHCALAVLGSLRQSLTWLCSWLPHHLRYLPCFLYIANS